MEGLLAEVSFDNIWDEIASHAGEVFYTASGLDYTYRVKGFEIFFSRKHKSITRKTIEMAYQRAVELDGQVKGPKTLGVFGASYIYPVFVKIGIISVKGKDGN